MLEYDDYNQWIPGLEDARFARLGGLHRNTFLNSPSLLDGELRLKNAPHIRFAGQITGVEGIIKNKSHDYVTPSGSLLDGPNIFLRSRYGVSTPFSVVVPQQSGGSGSGIGAETGAGSGIDVGSGNQETKRPKLL